MKDPIRVRVAAVAVTALLSGPVLAGTPPADEAFTLFRVLVGQTAPATGIPEVSAISGPFAFLGRSPEEDAKDVVQLMNRLKESYRLSSVSIEGASVSMLTANKSVEVPTPAATLGVRVTLVQADAKQAAYAISIAKTGENASEAKVVVARGERGLIGTRDGDKAPYVFLTIEPMPYRPGASEPPAVMPKLVDKVSPSYPEEARKARVSGVVLLDVVVGADGMVRDLKPLRTEPMGLTEAAVAAVRGWRYEPARDAAGKAVETSLTVTVSFMLDRSKAEPSKR